MSTSTTDNTRTDTAETLQIISTPPLQVAETDMVVCWSRRSTEKNPVAAAERYRGVTIKRAVLAVPAEKCNSAFHALLQSTIHNLADAAFTAWVKDKMQETQAPTSLLTLNNVLAFWAEEKQRQVIDGEKIAEWLKTSATYASLNEQQKKGWLNKLPKIAAPSYAMAFAKEQAAAIVSKLHADDLEHPACVFVAMRCNNVISKEPEVDTL